MLNLFEYQNKASLHEDFEELESFLDAIWIKREKNPFYFENEEEINEAQAFLQFLYKSKEIKSNKYVGVIHFNAHRINLLPKIFFDSGKEYSESSINQIHNHILWWLSYCGKIKFPNYNTSLGNRKSDFFEVLIYLFSKYTKNILSGSIYQQYEEVNKETGFMRGQLNINEYINDNLSVGRWDRLNCRFDLFSLDNEFNRIIKHVANLLFQATNSSENKNNLRDILFILDEVTDVRVTSDQCNKIIFNPMFSELELVRDYCKLFLSNCISFNYKNDLKLFAFLLPMEYIFEDFIFGFIEKEIPSIKVYAQRRDVYLDESKLFNLRPDLFFKIKDKSFIADTKYKIVYSDENDVKKSITQSDLYQMIAYAIRFDIDEIILFYPNTIKKYSGEPIELFIKDTLAANRIVSIRAIQLPIISKQLVEKAVENNSSLQELFESTRVELKEKIEDVFLNTFK